MTWQFCPGEMKTYVHAKTCTQRFIAALFTTVKMWKHPNVPQWMNGSTECSISIPWNVIWQQKGIK